MLTYLKTIWALCLINQTHRIRPLYLAMGQFYTSRGFYSPSPAGMVVDGLAMILAGIATAAYPIITIISAPLMAFTSPIFFPDDYRQVRKLVIDHRIDWRSGTVIDAEPVAGGSDA